MDMQALLVRLGGIRGIGGSELAPMTEADIRAFEEQLGVRLPDEYRRFLMTYGGAAFNGASPDNPYIVFRSLSSLPDHITKSNKALFAAFYGRERREHDSYGLRQRTRFFSGRMPDTLIPIGDDGGAGQICLGIKGAEAGKVYYWDQQNEPVDEEDYFMDYGQSRPPEAMFQNVHLIAESFEDFLSRLEIRSE